MGSPRFRGIALLAITMGSPFPALGQANQMASLTSDGQPPTFRSYYSVVSADGRFVGFQSEAALVPDDRNGQQDIYLRDFHSHETQLISVTPDGSAGNGLSQSLSISANGRYVAFGSSASNLIDDDRNGQWDIFLRDIVEQTTVRVSVTSSGGEPRDRSDSPTITPDGRYIFYHSLAALVPEDTNGAYDAYRYDTQTGDVIRVSVGPNGEEANGDNIWPIPSDDGNRVVFMSGATNLVTPDTNGWSDAIVKDLGTGDLFRANQSSSGTQTDLETTWPTISPDGQVVAFSSNSSRLVTPDGNRNWDLFYHDLRSRETFMVNVRPDGSQASGYTRSPAWFSTNGRFVCFATLSEDIVPDDNNGFQDVFVRDLVEGVTERVNFGYEGDQADDDSFVPAMTSDTRFITYTSEAANLIPNDTNGQRDIFLMDTQAGAHLSVDDLTRGANADFSVYGLEPDDTVYFGYSLRDIGDGRCFGRLGGLCIDLLDPVELIGRARANSNGVATLTQRIPANAPLRVVHMQAIVDRGSGSIKTNTVSRPALD